MKKIFIYMIIMFALVTFASASFSAEIISSDSLIQYGEIANYNINIKNNLDKPQSFRLVSSPDGWNVYTSPLSDYTFTIPPNQEREIKLKVSPRYMFETRPYNIQLRIRSLTLDETKNLNLLVQVYKPEEREYVPHVVPELFIPFEIDPRKTINLEIDLNNLNNRNISSLFLEISSNYFYEKKEIQLKPMEKKSLNVKFEIDDLTSPDDDIVKLEVWAEHNQRTHRWERVSPFRIIGYSELIKEKIEDSSFLRSEIKINLKNDANIKESYEIPVKVGYFKSFFSSFEPRYSYKLSSEEGRFLVWNFELDAQEEASIHVKTNYISLVIFILLIIAVIIAYYVLRPPIKIKKEVSHVGTSEGGISDIKVILFIKNRTSKVIEDISIIEKIPHLASIGKEFQIGTLMPSKVMQNPKKGTLVKWTLQTLEANEERIITYKIKSKLSILGGLTLPSTIVKFSVRGKESKTKSNRLNLDI